LPQTSRTPASSAAAWPVRATQRVSGVPWQTTTAGPADAPPVQSWTRRPSGSSVSSIDLNLG